MQFRTKIPFLYSFIFTCIFTADIILRTSYQAGKSPVLQVLALQLEASPALLGFIVSVSTITGFFFKPIVGWISDSYGKWIWLVIGTLIFCVPPFFYIFISNPEQLILVRLIHGISTAIYGPITMAILAEIAGVKKVEFYSWFGLSRIFSYILGPILGAVLLTLVDPKEVYTFIGLVSLLAFIPILTLRKKINHSQKLKIKKSIPIYLLFRTLKNSGVLIIGVMETQTKIAIYAIKTFLPLMMLSAGNHILEIGLFLSLQEAANAAVRPVSGTIVSKIGLKNSTITSLVLISLGLFILSSQGVTSTVWLVALLLGIGQGVFGPSTNTLVAETTAPSDLGLTFGIVGALSNAGKISGPIIAGILATAMTLQSVFAIIGTIPLIVATYIFIADPFRQRLQLDPEAH